jgi:cyclophilin family peptidyl-prolyl cis-trans isomerase
VTCVPALLDACIALVCWALQDFGFREGDSVRRIPFEVMVKGDKEPFYEETLEDAGRFNDEPVLPFNAYGTMALARSEFEPNSGSSQVFWLLKVCAEALYP